MKKLNYKNIILFIIMLIFTILFLKDWAIVLFKGATFTWFGITTNIMYLVIACSIWEHLKNYLEEKEDTK